MRIQTILNRVEKFKSFVYDTAHWEEGTNAGALVVRVLPRKNSRPVCSGCGRPGPTYDHLPERRFEFVPLWGLLVFFVYPMRRVDCRHCQAVKVEQVPWADGKNQLTTTYRWFLASWAKRLSWSEVAAVFHTSWESVQAAVTYAVAWGLKHRDLSGVRSLGIDEIAWRKGHTYLTLVYDIGGEVKRLLAVEEGRTEESLRRGLASLGADACRRIEYVCSDMWPRYLTVIAAVLSAAVHVLDRFHIMQKFGKALDDIRAEEAQALVRDGYEPLLKHARWCLLKRPANLTDRQTVKLRELLRYNLRSVRAYLLREDFQRFWDYASPTWAGKFLDEWTGRALRSRLEPLKKVARTLRSHRELLLNWFRARGQLSAGRQPVEAVIWPLEEILEQALEAGNRRNFVVAVRDFFHQRLKTLLERSGSTIQHDLRIDQRRRRYDEAIRLQIADPGFVIADGGVDGHSYFRLSDMSITTFFVQPRRAGSIHRKATEQDHARDIVFALSQARPR